MVALLLRQVCCLEVFEGIYRLDQQQQGMRLGFMFS